MPHLHTSPPPTPNHPLARNTAQILQTQREYEYLKQVPLEHSQWAPGLVPLDSQPHPGQEGLSLELLSCFVMLEGPTSSRWRREGPAALTHLEENQIRLKKEKEK